MNIPKTKEVDPRDIPEVVDFINADSKVKEFREQYSDLFETYQQLIEDRNSKLENAEKVVRAHKVTCGPFVLYQYQTKFNAQAFFDAVGKEDFLKFGGEMKTVPQYSIDKKQFEAFAAQRKIPQSVIDQVVEVSPRFKCPEKISL
jgi:hypothetical protein